MTVSKIDRYEVGIQCIGVQPQAEDVVNNYFGVSIVINYHAIFLCKCLPLAVNVMDEIDESRRALCWAKGHHGVGPFDGIKALESKLFLTGEGNGQLVIPMRASNNQYKIPMPNSLFIP
jgi:hypothetical protein